MLFFRLPYEDKIKGLQDSTNKDSVTFVPFSNCEKITFSGKIYEIDKKDLPKIKAADLPFLSSEKPALSREEYLKTAKEVIEFIKENSLKKLVLSREIVCKLTGDNPKNVDLTGTFLNLCKAYPNAFAYFFVGEKKCWMGAFSEVLGSYNSKNQEFKTMSLAGTVGTHESWTEKEIKEQTAVTEYIREILRKFSLNGVDSSAAHDHFSGNIKHLRTDFQTQVAPEKLEMLINELHPTPAVLGYPKQLCINALKTFEKHNRRLYAGYIKIKDGHKTDYFVNLRCARFYKNAMQIYAGGGITAESNPEREWDETELKSRAILDNLVIS